MNMSPRTARERAKGYDARLKGVLWTYSIYLTLPYASNRATVYQDIGDAFRALEMKNARQLMWVAGATAPDGCIRDVRLLLAHCPNITVRDIHACFANRSFS